MDAPEQPTLPTEANSSRATVTTDTNSFGRPVPKAGAGFQASLFFAFLGTWFALMPATSITLALKVNQIDPVGKAVSLSLVLGVGAFVALIAQNIFGALSDRTTSRWGMRRPWILGGMISGTVGLCLLAYADSIVMITLAWAFTQLTFNVLLAGLNPVLPDQVPKRQLGRVSGLIGLTQVLAGVGGAAMAQAFLPNLTLAILIPGGVFVVAIVTLLLVLRDRTQRKEDVRPFNVALFIKAFWTSPRKAPDFALAWVSRFMVMFGNMTLANYQLYFLLDRFGYTEATVGTAVLQLTLISGLTTMVSSLTVGWLSDKLARRKIFVLISALIIAVAHALAAFAPDFASFAIAAGIAGLATGVYLAVDQALIAEVLPSSTDVGKDMGVLHLANVLPQTLVPVTAPLFLSIGGGLTNYPALFVGGAVIGIIGAIVNQFIRSVR